LELTTAVRARYPQVPIILMTSQGNEEIAVEALRRGAASYVSKQLLSHRLGDTIAEVLALSRRGVSQARVMHLLAGAAGHYVLENDPELFASLVAGLQDEAVRLGLWDDAERMRVGIALQEALLNALYHGNLEISSELKEIDDGAFHEQAEKHRCTPPYCDRKIFVDAEISREKMRIVIRDEGRGFDPACLPDPTDPENIERPCGRGVLLMRTFMDEVKFNEAGNAVTLVKRCTSREHCPEERGDTTSG
jgi:CheY-like chemotaxis protein